MNNQDYTILSMLARAAASAPQQASAYIDEYLSSAPEDSELRNVLQVLCKELETKRADSHAGIALQEAARALNRRSEGLDDEFAIVAREFKYAAEKSLRVGTE